jgi:hypothetical protein
MLADGCRPPRDQSASLAGTRRNRHQANDSRPSTRCRSPGTSRVSVQRSSVPRSRHSVPARLRSSWPQLAATPSARVAIAVCEAPDPPGDIMSEHRATSSRNARATSSESAVRPCRDFPRRVIGLPGGSILGAALAGHWPMLHHACVWPRIKTLIPAPAPLWANQVF